jgi:hypothetical protein
MLAGDASGSGGALGPELMATADANADHVWGMPSDMSKELRMNAPSDAGFWDSSSTSSSTTGCCGVER